MRLLYFKLTDTPEELKEKRNQLAKKFHPDRNKNSNTNAIMQGINVEYDYVLTHRQEPPKKSTFIHDKEFLKQEAQHIFHALTNANGVDYNLLCQTFNNVTCEQLKPLSVIYFRTYGFQLLNHIQEHVKDKKTKEAITISLKIATGNIGIIDVFRFFKSMK